MLPQETWRPARRTSRTSAGGEDTNTFATPPGSVIPTHRFAHEAMATTFEVFIPHSDPCYAEQAAWAAFHELDRLEQELSRYVPNSDISRLNGLSANQSLRVGVDAFECLRLCARVSAETNGAFDVTIGPLLDCWLGKNRVKRFPSENELDVARQRTGMHRIEFDEGRHAVRLRASPVRIDLGGVGKGYAVDRMAALLREWSIEAALIHGGFSTVLGIGAPPGTEGWPITVSNPTDCRETLARFHLRDRAVSGSGLRKGRHIINPRTARPVEDKRAAWCFAPDAATADALSTAFMVMTAEEIGQYCSSHPDIAAIIVPEPQCESGSR